MRTIHVRRAQDTGPRVVEPVTIVIGDPIPETSAPGDPDWAAKAEVSFAVEARAISVALRSALPGGTCVRVLGELLDAHARDMLLRVPLGPPEPRRDVALEHALGRALDAEAALTRCQETNTRLEEENRAQRAELARLTDDYADVCRQLESVVEAAREENMPR